MSEPYVGEIRVFAGSFAPRDWAFCNGQLLRINNHAALFSVIGVQYGGDGKTTFALPNLQGLAPVHQGQGHGLTNRHIGETGGVSKVSLTLSEMPTHTHMPNTTAAPTTNDPTGAIWSNTSGRTGTPVYSTTSDGAQLSDQAIGLTGNNEAHNNRQPFLGLTFIICLNGIYPPRS